MILGQPLPGPTHVAIPTNTLRVIEVIPDEDAVLSMLKVYGDGLGGGAGPSSLRGLLFDGVTNYLIGTTLDLSVPQGAPEGWWDLRFRKGWDALPLEGGRPYRIGVHFGNTNQSFRLFVHDPGAGGSKRMTDVFEDGAPLRLTGDVTDITADVPVVAYAFTPYAPPTTDLIDDDYLATLPWVAAQKALTGGPSPQTAQPATCGWHGRDFDNRAGAIAIASSRGPISALVGERIQIECRSGGVRRAMVVYVTDEFDFPPEADDEDLSLPRDTFAQIARPTKDAIATTIRVIA